MAKEGKKEPISDLTKHNLKREEEVRAATKRLDEYLVTKFDLNKAKPRGVSEEKTQEEKPKASEAKEGEQAAKSTESKNDKKSEEKESEEKEPEAKATEK